MGFDYCGVVVLVVDFGLYGDVVVVVVEGGDEVVVVFGDEVFVYFVCVC